MTATTLSSCVLVQTHVGCCTYPGGTAALVAKKKELEKELTPALPSDRLYFPHGRDVNPVYVATPRGEASAKTPPVLLLHEMPGLSPDALELARCIAEHGYTVYVPLLFGTVDEATDGNCLFIKRTLSFEFTDPLWKEHYVPAANDEPSTRLPGVIEVEKLAHSILRRHPGQKLGVIGLCISGHLPMALAARMDEVAAPIISQPAFPLAVISPRGMRDVGLTDDEISRLHERIAKGYQILGFRFEYDHVSPRERFIALSKDFGSHGFLDRTLAGARYEKIDGLPHGAHAVLTTCYQPWRKQASEPASHYAYRQLIEFLDSKLKRAGEYRDPAPLSHSQDSALESQRGRCGCAKEP